MAYSKLIIHISCFPSKTDLEEQCWSFILNENLFNEDTAFAAYREARLRKIAPVIDIMVCL